MRVAVIGEAKGASSRQLRDALRARGAEAVLLPSSELVVDLERGEIRCGSTDLAEMDAVAVKKVDRAQGPDQLDRLELLHHLAEAGVPVFSRPLRIMRVLNRLACTAGLRRQGIPMPPTTVTADPEEAKSALERYGRAVLKPLYGTKARGMELVDADAAGREAIERFRAENPVVYVQQAIALPGRDMGLAFVGGRYLGAYARVAAAGAWNTTTRSGGSYEPAEPDDEIVAMAKRAQAPFGLDFTCVDVAETREGPVVFEVSAFGGFRGLREGAGVDAADAFAQHILAEASA